MGTYTKVACILIDIQINPKLRLLNYKNLKVEQRANKGYRVLVWEDEKVQDLNSSDNMLVLSITKQYGKND